MEILGVVLSGGKSLRMGKDKGLMVLNNKQMVQYSISLLKNISNEIVISTSNSEYKKFGLKLIPDHYKNIGPLGGIFSVLNLLPFEHYFVCPCDMPFASANLASELIKHATNSNYDIVIPEYNNRPEPLFGIYSNKVLPKIKQQITSGDYKMQNLLKISNTYYYKLDDAYIKKNSIILKNINSPDDV